MSKFEYRYSAPTEEERKEINGIRRQYVTEKKEESKIERLRRLDAKVKNGASCVALSFGIIGCLIFGLGMTAILEWKLVWQGVLVGIVGVAGMGSAYPVYRRAFERGKRKYGEEIVRLSEELLNEKE